MMRMMFRMATSVCVAAALALGIGLTSGTVDARARAAQAPTNPPPNLFIESRDTALLLPSVSDAQVRRRSIRIDLDLLGGALATGPMPPALTLNLFPNVVLTTRWVRTDETRLGRSWIGAIDGEPLGQVVLTVVRGAVAGQVTMPGGSYTISGSADGRAVVAEVDDSLLPPEAPPIRVPDPIDPPADTSPLGAADDASFVDLLVAYTSTARIGAGGGNAIGAAIELATAQANQAYQNSGIGLRLRLVGVVEVDYNESRDSSTDLVRLRTRNDGYLDGVSSMRDGTAADLVTLVLESIGDACGRGYQIAANTPDLGYNVVQRNCLTNQTLPHELGHNMGAAHDWYVDDGPGAYTYSHGHVDTTGRWRTVMAYPDVCTGLGISCPRLLQFSNPGLLFNGRQGGVPAGTNVGCKEGNLQNPPCDADNARTLNNRSPIVANFRTSLFTGTAVAFPPRNETFAFRNELEAKYRDGLRRPAGPTFADVEGAVVWTQEYLLYRLYQCNHQQAINSVRIEIAGNGLPAACGAVPAGTINFPPRNETLVFRNTLEGIYRDELRRPPVQSTVDVEGEVVWVQEYLRYRLNRCGHAQATERVMLQIDGRGIQPTC